jgi:energy-coupling factor transporter ATP-binding protein EcfA2
MSFIENLKRFFGFIEIQSLESVFTPTRAAKLNYVSRSKIEGKVSRAIKIPGNQIILYGHSGSGKTTLVRNILEKNHRNYIVTSCINGTTVNELIINAFDKLNPYYTSESTYKISSKISSSMKASYGKIEASLAAETSEELTNKLVRVLPVQLTFERLGSFLGAAECVWVIEDFHKVDDDEKQKLSDIMKAFVDIANDFEKVKIIAIGAVSTAREVVNYSPNIESRIAEIPVPLLSEKELREIITNGANILNITFEEKLIDETIFYSNSLGSLCHQLCYLHCEQMGVENTRKRNLLINSKVLHNSIEGYVSQKSDTFQQKLDKALKQRKAKFENVKLILNAFIDLKKEVVTYNEILSKIQQWEPDYPQSNLTVYLKPLTTNENDEIIRFDENSGKYSFSDPFFKAFCAMALEKIERSTDDIKVSYIDVKLLMEKLDKIISENQ